MSRSEPIERLKGRFRREWLLIAVDKMDESTTTPLTGRLIAHSPHRDEIYRESRKRRKGLLLIDCTPDILPKDVRIVFLLHRFHAPPCSRS